MFRLLVLLGMCLLCPASFAADRPNILYIVADDLGYADLGCQNLSKDVKTPHIDSIAAGGVRFTNGDVSCPVCAPTRAGLITGRYQQRFGFEFNPGPNAAENFGLPLDQVSLPQALKEAGYATGMVGKWHLGFKPEMHPNRRGFDEFFGFLAGAHAYNRVGEGNNVLMRNSEPLESTDYLTDAFGREAAAFVDRHAGKPFFLYLAFNAIHTPMQAPQKYLERFPDEKDDKRRTMLAMLSAMDDAVGQTLAAVEKHGQMNSTLIIFHSDNGGPTKANGSLNTPLRGLKGDVWEGGIRVPFLMQWTGRVPAGKVDDRPVIALDVFPTALAAAGADTPKGVEFDGVDLLAQVAADGAEASKSHRTLFWRYGAQRWAIRDGNYKLVHAGPDAAPQLFDLASDIGEQKDISGQQQHVAKRLQAQYDQWNAQMEKPRWRDPRTGRGEKQEGAGGKRRQGGANQ